MSRERRIGLLGEREGVGVDVRGGDAAEARESDGAAAAARAHYGGDGAEARVRAVLEGDRERLGGARLRDARDVDLGHVAAVVDVPGRRECRRRATADCCAPRSELPRAEAEARSRGDADRHERCGQRDTEDVGQPLHVSSPRDLIGAGRRDRRPAHYGRYGDPCYATTTEMPVTRLASTFPDVEMFAVV